MKSVVYYIKYWMKVKIFKEVEIFITKIDKFIGFNQKKLNFENKKSEILDSEINLYLIHYQQSLLSYSEEINSLFKE
jgi:hypothetical protein